MLLTNFFISVSTPPTNTKPIIGVKSIINLALLVNFPLIITTTSTNHGKKLSNLAKIYINKAKYSSWDNNFIFKLGIFYNIFVKANDLSEPKIKIFFTMLKDLTLEYYYSNIRIGKITINFH